MLDAVALLVNQEKLVPKELRAPPVRQVSVGTPGTQVPQVLQDPRESAVPGGTRVREAPWERAETARWDLLEIQVHLDPQEWVCQAG